MLPIPSKIAGILHLGALDFPLEFQAGIFSFFLQCLWIRNRRSIITKRWRDAIDPSCTAGDLVISAIIVSQISDLTIEQWLAVNYELSLVIVILMCEIRTLEFEKFFKSSEETALIFNF